MHFFQDIGQFFIEMPALFYAVVGIVGLCVGSFLNVVIYRLPKIMENEFKEECHYFLNPNEPYPIQEKFSLSIPASTCPKCRHRIRWYENIPLISWTILLRGKCSHCANPISIRYPLVEFATMLASLVVAYTFGVSIATCVSLVFTWILIALMGIDFDTQLLPDRLVYPLLGLGLAINSTGGFVGPVQSIWGTLFGFLSLWSICFIFKLITGKQGMGHGDFKLLAAVGAWLGVGLLPFVIFTSAILGSIIGGILFIIYKESRPFAFGPYIAIAAWVALLWGNSIISSYLSLF